MFVARLENSSQPLDSVFRRDLKTDDWSTFLIVFFLRFPLVVIAVHWVTVNFEAKSRVTAGPLHCSSLNFTDFLPQVGPLLVRV